MSQTFSIKDWVRPHLRTLTPYSSARDEFSGVAHTWLDANENPEDLSGQGLNRYPDPYQRKVKVVLAKRKEVRPEQIFLGNGSDEAIDLLVRLSCDAQSEIIICPPTYGMYKVAADLQNVSVKEVPLTADFQLNVPGVLEAVSPNTKLIFLCSPNNPTGNVLESTAVEEVLLRFKGLVVMDEAYVDFSQEVSWLTQLDKFPNLAVLQTFSKAWGMAGARVGMAFGQPELIRFLNKIKPPYNVNELSQKLVLEVLEQEEKIAHSIQQLVTAREVLRKQLEALPIVEKVYPSQANFLLVKVQEASIMYQKLLTRGIVVRDRSKVIPVGDCLRITIGNEKENAAIIQNMKQLI